MSLPTVFVIFGATGDLTHRKLLPALYYLAFEKLLPPNFSVICVARRAKSTEEFREETQASVKQHSRAKIDQTILEEFVQQVHYVQAEFGSAEDFHDLRSHLEHLLGQQSDKCNRLFYLAVSPQYFETIVHNLDASGLSKKRMLKGGYTRVVFEKPFGHNLVSARHLNQSITSVFGEHEIYRIDHYLGKELVQNIMTLRFANVLFEPLWSTNYIDHVQITVAESLGVEGRAGYYEKSGALRDVVQNHLLQLLCLVAMAPPKSMSADDIRNEKVKVLQSLTRIKDTLQHTIKGQYTDGSVENKRVKGYREEEKVDPQSLTETFFATKVYVDMPHWKRVPFYLRTGKRLKDRATEIVIVYKQTDKKLFSQHHLQKNAFRIRVQPDEGMILHFNSKVPGNKLSIEQVSMDYCHQCQFGPNTPEAYERLLHDVMVGDQTLFTRWDEVEHAWVYIDKIAASLQNEEPHLYSSGTWGPRAAEDMIARKARHWITPKKPRYADK